MTQGREANNSGSFLEEMLSREFARYGVPTTQYSEDADNLRLFDPRMLVANVSYRSIFGCDSRSEFVFRDDIAGHAIRIECRWQQVAGSVDEKLPYLLLNAIETMPEQEIWLVVAGGGARDEAIEWLEKNAAKCMLKTIRVITDLAELRSYIRAAAQKTVAVA